MAKRWRIAPHDSERIAQLERAAGIPAVVAQLLIGRGIADPQQAREFLAAKLSGLRDPDALPGATAAAKCLAEAVARNQRIVVYGDYDADGMTGTAILLLCLRLLGANCDFYVPNRLDEGYGLNDGAFERLAADGTQWIITVDCGITSVEQADTARRLGIQLIITDHHAMATRLPEAEVLVHPRLPGYDYPFDGLAGAGVAFKVAWALCKQVAGTERVGERMKRFLLQAVGLAAIGTVADVVPLVDENRILVRHGLTSLREYATAGINALAKVTKVDQKPTLASEDIAFMLAPRLNAAGRLGQAQLAVELMTTSDPARAKALADYIDQLNGSRESLERSIYLAAHRQAQELFNPQEDAALVLAGHRWHPGVIGIVAGRLAEKYHRPVVLIALDELGVKPGVGSARSVPGFDLHQALQVCSANLLTHGGHAAAAGLKIKEEELDAFRAAFCEYAAEMLTEAHRVAELWIDGETSLNALSLKTVQQIEQLAPFGQGNARPVLCASNVTMSGPPKRIGGGGRHLALSFSQHGTTFRSVAFGGGDWADQLAGTTAPLQIAFRPTINHFRGRRSVELHLADWRIAEPAADEDAT